MTRDEGAAALELAMKPRRTDVAVGEALELQVSLTNESDAPVPVPSATSASPFAFELTSGAQHLALSQGAWRDALAASDTRVPDAHPLEPLAPGEATTLVEDLARYAQGALGPGAWSIVGRLGKPPAISKPVTVTVRPFAPVAVASVFDPLRESFAVLAAEEKPEPVLFHRLTPSEDPRQATFQRTAIAPEPARPEGVAVALHTSLECAGRWFAVVTGTKLRAAHTSGRLLRLLSSLDCAEGSRLVGAGAQLADSAAFVLVEPAGAGVRLRLVVAHADRIEAGAPVALAAVPTHTAVEWSKDGATAHVLVGEPGPKASKVSLVALTRAGGAAKPLCERPGRIRALAAAGVATGPGAGKWHGVFGPDADGRFEIVAGRFDGTTAPPIPFAPSAPPIELAVSPPGGAPWVAWTRAGAVEAACPPAPAVPVAQPAAATHLAVWPTAVKGVFVEFLEGGAGLRDLPIPGTVPP